MTNPVQTLTKSVTVNDNPFMKPVEWLSLLLLAGVILVVLPLALDGFRLNLVGKYLTYAFVALGLVICWGYAGILSLGQGVFFGLGGYCMAMYLKLEASSIENTKIQSTPGIPDFMDWNQITALPWFWQPFKSLPLTLILVVAVPVLFAMLISYAMFKRRVGGTYFAIITQAIAAILTILIVGQQGYTGGINGITDLRTLHGWDIRTDHAKVILYFVNGGLLIACILAAQYVKKSKLGRILVAMRDKEDRVRFSGYSVAGFKVFAFCFAAGLRGDRRRDVHPAGRLHVALLRGHRPVDRDGDLRRGRRAPVPVRRGLGTLLVNWAKTSFSESFPDLWLFGLGALFIAVVLAFPNGLAGIWREQIEPRLTRRVKGLRAPPPAIVPPHGAPAE